MGIIGAILIFCFLILIHEGGHFIAAKLMGVKVNEFAIGMGPAIYKKQKGETLYSLRALPIGGYCAMEGENENSEDEKSFSNKNFFAKAFILVAGALMNFLFAILIMCIISFSIGVETVTIEKCVKNMPADISGMIEGDKIISIENKKIKTWQEVVNEINSSKKNTLEIKVERNGNMKILEIPVQESEDGNRKIGIIPKYKKDVAKSMQRGIIATFSLGEKMIDGVKSLITGEVSRKSIVGIVGITVEVSKSIKSGMIHMGYMTALISLNLAIVNMLPFPALDGGRLFVMALRKVAGKIITEKVENVIHFTGIIMLLGLMVYVTFQDIIKIVK